MYTVGVRFEVPDFLHGACRRRSGLKNVTVVSRSTNGGKLIKMKKTNLIWMIAMLLFGTLNFTACSDKEDEGSGSTNNEISISNLTGLWQSE